MATPDTRTQLLDAAERLFAEHGYSGTSVRAITDRAGANVAAVGYHFGSKAQLMAAVARRAIEPITAAQSAGLDRLLAEGATPAVAELVEAFAGPMFDAMPAGDPSGARRSRLIVTILTDPAEETRAWSGPAEQSVQERFAAAFRLTLPDLSGDELFFRMRGVLAVTAVDRVSPAEGQAARHFAMTFLSAAMGAPPTRI
ncbi:TetR/AcrR family transcriptional regulator [Actinoplanes couchii]|uniref:TetR family transcriptional regulator n=1 Tax=Actinoplanes couchii TaxID=403638 RepID=A0ABQ3XPM7_9ACTN|nr:TetR/AcrR family transcriptional regulator [Actinoplanes couchii]MDR6319126.1 AcrR family transcriptional regulator [Actinoplanes couchii]GID60467.1 TetR family transcriptional regulator [Actinoplanes couchii]